MAEPSGNPPIYDALMAVKPDMSLNRWAVEAKLSRNVFIDIKRHGNPTSETVQKLLDVAKVSYAEFDAALAPVRSEVRAAGLSGAGDVRRAYHGSEPMRALPLLGSAIGDTRDLSDIDEHVELVELNLGEVLDYLARPASLANDKDAYALTILSDSMAPKFEPGDRVAVSPREPVSIGDYVIVQLRGAEGSDDRVTMVLIKRLVRRSGGYIELEQFNPAVTFRVDARRVASTHKVAGTLF